MPVSEMVLGDTRLTGLVQQCQGGTRVEFDWLQQLRGEATERLQAARLPTRRDEEWRFTDLSPLLAHEFQALERTDVDPEAIAAMLPEPEAGGRRLVFVNGIYAEQLSDAGALPEGVFAGSLADLDADRRQRLPQFLNRHERGSVFADLNAAGLRDAAVVWVDANIAAGPVYLLFLTVPGVHPGFAQPRAIAILERSAELTLVEQYGTPEAGAPYLTNGVTELWLGANARLDHARCQFDAAEGGFHIGRTAVTQARDSHYQCYAIGLGAEFSRHDLDVYVAAEQCDTRLNGLTLVDGARLADTHSSIRFQAPHCTSDQLHKCIVGDRARAVFNGKVFVPQVAQQTNAAQLNRNLLLSPRAHVDTKPQLQITADDVKCAHGATVSQLEADELFYLQSRGLTETEARELLVDAFAAEVLKRIRLEPLRARLFARISARLSARPELSRPQS